MFHLRLTVSAVSNVLCVHTATPQTLVYTVNATSCVVSKTLALKEIGDGRGGVRFLLAGLTNFMVLEFFVATKLSLCHSPFPPSGTVLRANIHVPTNSSSLCSTALSAEMSSTAVRPSQITGSGTLKEAESKSYRLCTTFNIK